MKYSDFVDYRKLDPFKKKILKFLEPTFNNLSCLRIKVVKESVGEPGVLVDFLENDFYLAFKSDGVGTKNKIADWMIKKDEKIDRRRLYSGLGVDLIAMNANDLICLGARPFILSDEVAAGESSWFEKKEAEGLLEGFKKGCNKAGATIASGETPTLKDVIYPDSVNITGSMIGIVRPKKRVILGQKLKEGDVIYGLASFGIHANGLTLARKIVEKLPQGYFTFLGKKTVGEELLKETRIYVRPILEMIDKKVEIHYLSNVTGGGFRKIMRAKKRFSYVIDKLPRKKKIFKFLQEKGKVSDKEAYQTWNMGVGFVVFAPKKEEGKIEKICKKHKIGFYKLGRVEKGDKKVVIKPLGICYREFL